MVLLVAIGLHLLACKLLFVLLRKLVLLDEDDLSYGDVQADCNLCLWKKVLFDQITMQDKQQCYLDLYHVHLVNQGKTEIIIKFVLK